MSNNGQDHYGFESKLKVDDIYSSSKTIICLDILSDQNTKMLPQMSILAGNVQCSTVLRFLVRTCLYN